MKKIGLLILAVGLVFRSCSVKPVTEGKIVVDMANRGADVPSSMYGVFFEEINHGGDGGLYAEMVQNRSFEEKEVPAGYSVEGNRLRPAPVKNHLTGKTSGETYRWSEEECPGWSIEPVGTDKVKMHLTKINPLHQIHLP